MRFGKKASETRFRAFLPTMVGWFLAAVLISGCAKDGNMNRLDQENQVQNQRLLALEKSSGGEISKLVKEMEEMRTTLQSVEGKLHVMREQINRLQKEQQHLSGNMEKNLAAMQAVTRRVDKSGEGTEKLLTEQSRDLDAMRLRLNDIEKILKSSMASLPDKTRADLSFRTAWAHLISGELDMAADRFRAFGKIHAKDPRSVDALYWQGQAYFLMRKYDHALVAFFEVVEKHPGHPLATGSRWMLARALEETGDLKLARDFYSQLIADNTAHKADATRRLHFINRLFGNTETKEPKPAAPKKPAQPSEKKSGQNKTEKEKGK